MVSKFFYFIGNTIEGVSFLESALLLLGGREGRGGLLELFLCWNSGQNVAKNSVEVFRYSDKVETVKSIENLKLLIIS